MGTDKNCRLPRRARVTSSRVLCSTGTVLLSFRIAGDESFDFEPGQVVAIDCVDRRRGYRAMIAEMPGAPALMEVPRRRIFEESFINPRHKPSRENLLRIRDRFSPGLVPRAPWDEIATLPVLDSHR